MPLPDDAPSSAAPTRRGRCILVVDDHVDTLTLMARMLAKAGYDVLTAEGVNAALATAAGAASLDLLITDVQLQDGDGAHLCRCLCEQRPALAAIAVTGHPPEADTLPDFCAHLTKPIDFPTLLAVIDRCLTES